MPAINNFPVQVNISAKSTNVVAGGQVVTYATSYTDQPALLTDASAALKLIYAQRNVVVTHVIYLPAAVTINTGDIVVYGSRKFFIVGNLDPSGTGRIFEIHCSEVTPGSMVVEQ
jgi:hypothetical protein